MRPASLWIQTTLALFAVGILTHRCCGQSADHSSPVKKLYLDQGWSEEERERFYFTPQGSQLIPYDWFLALEKHSGGGLFRDNSNLERLRFITRSKSERNPDGLPVGFVKDALNDSRTKAQNLYQSKKSGKPAKGTEKTWLGLTCAACHTAQLDIDGKSLQIDGAPSMADFQTFLKELSLSLDDTHRDAAKMQRFAKRLGDKKGLESLKAEVQEHAQTLNALVERNRSTHPYGFARLDAFGAILNAVCEDALDIRGNRVESNAPVSYPFLWDTPKLSWVQWNGSANVATARNVGEVLGVFGFFTLQEDDKKHKQFDSTVRLKSLIELESWIDTLKAPVWPEDLLGKLDPGKVQLGKTLFARNCAECHQLRNAQGKFKMVDMAGQEKIETRQVPFEEIKSDPQMIRNLAPAVDPGLLREFLSEPQKSAPLVPRPLLLKIAVREVAKRRAESEGIPLPRPVDPTKDPTQIPLPFEGKAYTARSLEGIWSTAPYLHNGSVPNLYELLLPSARRSKSFYVGSRKFDRKLVGFERARSPGAFEFRVADENGPIAGNSNLGHEGHGSQKNMGYTETFEDGGWREFTDEERFALVEFMKSLGKADASPTGPDDGTKTTQVDPEKIPEDEARQIENIVDLTIKQLKNRYSGQRSILRGVHAKDHGCVKASFEVLSNLEEKYRVGVFAEPGRRYDAWIRFSNAATLVLPDDSVGDDGKPTPGSRGMAIKLLNVNGAALTDPHGSLTQDFLLVNHPVFAFANVEDYEVLSTVLADPANKERPNKFFKIQADKGGEAAARARESGLIIGKIQAPTGSSNAFQAQPACPTDCNYFSGAPFRFGFDHVMKYGAFPIDAPANPKPNVADPNYLRTALIERLNSRKHQTPVIFEFKVQLKAKTSVDVSREIENACTNWPRTPGSDFVTVAKITIHPQDFDTAEHRAQCENLTFTPWHGLSEHRPLGGINRMRKAVYEASTNFRHLPKEPIRK